VEADYNQAARWFQKAAESGDPKAQQNLAMMYYKGQGLNQDYHQAAKWYLKAADNGDSKAQHNLGIMYCKGQGVIVDYIQSYAWFNLANASGHQLSLINLNHVKSLMTPQQIAEGQNLAREKWKKINQAMGA
jgi:hypothetical protein